MCFSSSINDLPPHTIVEILSRLPVKTIIHCRCVCRAWRDLLLEPYFANLHLSRSPTTLMIHQISNSLNILKLVEFEDDQVFPDLHYDPAMKFDLRVCYPNGQILVVGTVNGFLCFCDYTDGAIHICNPTVREYVTLPKPTYRQRYPSVIVYGFGFSSISGEYKVVQISQRALSDPAAVAPCSYKSLGEVYTLGTGRWRSVGTVPFLFDCRYSVSLNDNVHWLISDVNRHESICCFDIDKEAFRSFSSPPDLISKGTLYKYKSLGLGLGLLEGCLFLCDNSSNSDLVIWVMKEYGIKESWAKEIVIRKSFYVETLSYEVASPIKVWKNGYVLMLWGDDFLFSYSPESGDLYEVRVPQDSDHVVPRSTVYKMMLYVVSFRSLKDFATEKVCIF